MRALRHVSQLLVMIAVCACARATTLEYDFHIDPANDAYGTFPAADIFYTSSDNMTFTYLSGSINGFVPPVFSGMPVGSGWVYSSNIDLSVPINSVAALYIAFNTVPSGPGGYTTTEAARGILLGPTLIGFDYVGGSLTITDASIPVPEPMAGMMKRRRRRVIQR
jgi:hypothetical protein